MKITNPNAAVLSVEEAAELLGLGRNTAYRAARRGDIPAIKIGGRLLVVRARLEAMLAGTNGNVDRQN